MNVLDSFRVKRNAIDYTGQDVDEASVRQCIEAAEELLDSLLSWLAAHRPDLLS